MLHRVITPFVRSVRLQPRNVLAPVTRLSSYHEGLPPATMDDLPIPNGSWETQYKANQAKYNKQLAFGIIFTAITLIVAKSSGLLYFNFNPPSSPAPRE